MSYHPIIIDDDGEIQRKPLWTNLTPGAMQSLFTMLNNAPLVATRIIMNEEDFKDIIEWSDSNLYFDKLKVTS